MRLPRFVLLSVLIFSVSILPASAQIAGELTGSVLDRSEAGVANATIHLIETSTNVSQTTVSTSSGNYVFINLNPGSYRLEVSATGFERLNRSGVTVVTGQTVTADLTLTVGAQRQTITVTDDAPLLQAATSNIQTNIPAPTIVGHAAQHAEFRAASHARSRRRTASRHAPAPHQRRPSAHQ